MTMAKVENGSVAQVGVPAALRGAPMRDFKAQGWRQIVSNSTGKPADAPAPGYQWVYRTPWSVEDGNVVGSWRQSKRPQPYPSWSFVEGQGWVAPTPEPDDGKQYVWDEANQQWLQGDPDELEGYGPWPAEDIPAVVLQNKREAATLTRADFKLALLEMGELANVKATIEDANTPERAKILWEDALEFKRLNEDFLAMAAAVGYSDAQMDQLFGIG